MSSGSSWAELNLAEHTVLSRVRVVHPSDIKDCFGYLSPNELYIYTHLRGFVYIKYRFVTTALAIAMPPTQRTKRCFRTLGRLRSSPPLDMLYARDMEFGSWIPAHPPADIGSLCVCAITIHNVSSRPAKLAQCYANFPGCTRTPAYPPKCPILKYPIWALVWSRFWALCVGIGPYWTRTYDFHARLCGHYRSNIRGLHKCGHKRIGPPNRRNVWAYKDRTMKQAQCTPQDLKFSAFSHRNASILYYSSRRYWLKLRE
jgi:hypothetical protein